MSLAFIKKYEDLQEEEKKELFGELYNISYEDVLLHNEGLANKLTVFARNMSRLAGYNYSYDCGISRIKEHAQYVLNLDNTDECTYTDKVKIMVKETLDDLTNVELNHLLNYIFAVRYYKTCSWNTCHNNNKFFWIMILRLTLKDYIKNREELEKCGSQAKDFDTSTLTALANEGLDITDNLLYIKITGKAGHGKDTLADMLKEHLERGGLSVLKLSYADALKEEAKKWFGWNGVKDEKGRKILQDVGTQYRGFDEDFWVKEVDKKILKETQKNPDLSVIILPDCRYENEYKKDKGKTIRIEVRRPFYNSSLTDEQQKHESENGITSKPDISIINNSLEQLEQWVIGYIIPNIENKLGCYL